MATKEDQAIQGLPSGGNGDLPLDRQMAKKVFQIERRDLVRGF